MYYEKLSEEYFKEAQILKKHINKLKAERAKINEEHLSNMNFRISTLYAMYLDLKHTSEYLNRKCEVMKRGK